MKYTRSESNEVIEVKGCAKCPHMVADTTGFTSMVCNVPVLGPNNKYKPRNKKLIGQWTGAYHATCPLASDPKLVPENPKNLNPVI